MHALDPPVGKPQALVNMRRRPLDVMAHDDDGCASESYSVECGGKFGATACIEPGERFVEHKKRDAASDEPSKQYSSLFTAAEFVDATVE